MKQNDTNTFSYNATSSEIFVQIRQAGTYYLDNIRMYRVVEETVVVEGVKRGVGYRYGFNGQERDDEVSGEGNSYTAEFWQYDSRAGRRWNIDPLTFKYPWQSPYAVFNNNPIFFNDPLGLEGEDPKGGGDDDIEMEQDLPGVDVIAKRTEKVIERQISIILELSNPEGADKFRRSEMAFKTAQDAVGNKKYDYSSIDLYRDYRKFGWCAFDPGCYQMSNQEQRELRQEWGDNWEEFALWVHNVAFNALLFAGGEAMFINRGYTHFPKFNATKTVGKFKFPGNNPAKAPKGFKWKGKPGSTPGSKNGNWYNPKTGESLRPDLNHPNPIEPHWDYKDVTGKWWRIFSDGSNVPK